jgi:hypothetical protein
MNITQCFLRNSLLRTRRKKALSRLNRDGAERGLRYQGLPRVVADYSQKYWNWGDCIQPLLTNCIVREKR